MNWYAYGFRYYDPTIGRFTGVDPIAHKFPHVTVYNYAENSPIANIDLWGLQKFFAGDGSFIGRYGNSTEERVINKGKNIDLAKKVFSYGDPTQIKTFVEGTFLSENFSKPLYRSDDLNQLYDEFAINYQEAEVEHAMAIYEKLFFDENGTPFEGYQPGKVSTSDDEHYVDLSASTFPGSSSWKIYSAIHNHPNNTFFSGGDDDYPRYAFMDVNDIGWSLEHNAKVLLVRPNSERIATFDPNIYNMIMTLNNYSKYRSWEHRPSVREATTERKIGE